MSASSMFFAYDLEETPAFRAKVCRILIDDVRDVVVAEDPDVLNFVAHHAPIDDERHNGTRVAFDRQIRLGLLSIIPYGLIHRDQVDHEGNHGHRTLGGALGRYLRSKQGAKDGVQRRIVSMFRARSLTAFLTRLKAIVRRCRSDGHVLDLDLDRLESQVRNRIRYDDPKVIQQWFFDLHDAS